MTELVDLRIGGGIATIEIRREKNLNALNAEVLSGLSAACDELRRRTSGAGAYDDCRLAVVRGAGEKAFVAGADIKEMRACSPEQLLAFTQLGQRVMRELEALPLPVIAVIPGFAIGGGLELALACDLILAGERARLGQAEVKLGLIPGFGGTQRLVDRVGIGRAKRLIFTGTEIPADEAFRIGLVDYLVANEQLESKLDEVCKTLLARSPLALAAAKRCIERHVQPLKLPGLETELREFVSSFASADAAEGLDAFVSKRQPVFRGKYE